MNSLIESAKVLRHRLRAHLHGPPPLSEPLDPDDTFYEVRRLSHIRDEVRHLFRTTPPNNVEASDTDD